MTLKAAARYVAQHHRHNRPPQGGLFAAGAMRGGQLVGVVIVGRPVARLLDDGKTAEATRLCTDGTRNSCSLLYGAAARLLRPVDADTLRWRALQDARGLVLREGVTYRAAGVTHWQLRRSVAGRVNQVDLIVNGAVWRTVSLRAAERAIRWGKWPITKPSPRLAA